MSRLFIVIATGQGIANVPPVLAMADKGDKILWLESALARACDWVQGPQSVFDKHSIRQQARTLISDLPHEAGRQLVDGLARGHAEGRDIVFVGNGGQKPISNALTAAMSAAGIRHAVIYGQDRPAEWWHFPIGMGGEMERHAYDASRHPVVTLDDVLACSESHAGGANRLCIWPPGATDPMLALETNGYGVDPERTAAPHELYVRNRAIRKAKDDKGNQEILTYDEAETILGEEMGKWRQGVINDTQALHVRRQKDGTYTHNPARAAIKSPNEDHQNRFRNIFGRTVKLEKKARRIAAGLQAGDVGTPFENAVARRVLAWLQNEPPPSARNVISEVWVRTKVWRRSSTAEKSKTNQLQELDIAFVLTNGILLALECKAAKLEAKDLDARLLNLQTSASRLARMAICVPIYTRFSDRPWFRDYHERMLRIKPTFRVIPFTLPDQPTEYRLPETDGEGAGNLFAEAVSYPCPPFEKSLEDWIKPYVPEPAKAHAPTA